MLTVPFSLAPTFRRLVGLVVVALCVLLAAPTQASTPDYREIVASKRPPLVVVQGVGPVPDAYLYTACRSLIELFEPFPVRCEKGRTTTADVFSADWDPRRRQLDGRAALERMFRDRIGHAHVELVVTNVDLFEEGRAYVFGLASLTDRVAIVSTARLGGGEAMLHERLRKLVLHEVGHTLGLSHDHDRGCVMRTDSTVASLDEAPTAPCSRCRRVMIEQAGVMSRPGQIALDNARGYLARGELAHAKRRVAAAIEQEPVDVTILNEIAQSFLSAGQIDTALRVLETTLERAPQFAHAHINFGIALRERGKLGDLVLALEHFDEAVRIEPAWSAHADQLRQDIAHAQGPRRDVD